MSPAQSDQTKSWYLDKVNYLEMAAQPKLGIFDWKPFQNIS